jgi:hypothetical protein
LTDTKNIKCEEKSLATVSQFLHARTDNGEGDVAKILAAVLPISLANAPNRYEEAHRNRNL